MYHQSVTAVLVFAFGMLAFAQGTPGQWVKDLYYVDAESGSGSALKYHKYFIDEKNNVVDSHDYMLSSDHEFRGTAFGSFWYGEESELALYSLSYRLRRNKETGSKHEEYLYLKWQDDEWHLLGKYNSQGELKGEENAIGRIRFFPCGDNRFIAISWDRDLVNDKRSDRSPFAVVSVRPTQKELVIDRSIDFGIDELQGHMSDPKVFSLPANARHMVAGKYGIIINPTTGLYWCFSLEKASLVKAGNIYKGLDPDEVMKTIKRGGLTQAVLCANPEKDGTVLVSALEEASLKGGVSDKWDDLREKYEKPLSDDLPEEERDRLNKEREKAYIEAQKKIAKGSPYIVWYRIHPENGRVEKLGVPPVGGAHERAGFLSKLWLGMEFYRADEWRPMPDGSVKMQVLNVKAPKENEGK